MKTPAFAVLGDVNPGKSAVVAALAQDSSAGISPTPGETSEARRFTYKGIFDVWDTPGFQRPLKMLREVQEAKAHPDPLAVFRAFLERHRNDPLFHTECELLKPILEEGAALIYVVDPSRTFSKLHEAETEILKMTARPLVVVFNATKQPDPENEQRWGNHIKQHFGQAAVEFNAHRASARDRAGLIREFAKKCAGWGEPYCAWGQLLQDAARMIEQDFSRDLGNAAGIVVDLLQQALAYRAEGFAAAGASERVLAAEREKLVVAYKDAVQRLEARSHQKLIENFGHQGWITLSDESPDFYKDGLFDAETAQVLGLSLWMLTAAAGGTGFAAGGLLDLKVGGASWGAGAVLGSAVAATSAFLAGRSALEPATREETEPVMARVFRTVTGNRLATGTKVSVGPVKNDNFVFILLDRAVGLIGELVRRTHARRDTQSLSAAELKQSLDVAHAATEVWPRELRSACLTFAKRTRAGKATDPMELQAKVAEQLQRLFGAAG